MTTMSRFQKIVAGHGLQLQHGPTRTLQVNIGHLCNLACRHCHVDASPHRTEVMSRETMDAVVDFARRFRFSVIDITGGAPELVPGIEEFIEQLAPLCSQMMFRTNLTLLLDDARKPLLDVCLRQKVVLVASFPSMNRSQADAQRGQDVYDRSILILQKLNALGYGMPGSDLLLHLVANPAGAFLPAGQCAAESRFKADLARKWGIHFSHLYTFANVPLGRFRAWLESSGNLVGYFDKLAGAFNPATIDGLMCRSLISVSWEGILYDCDFNLAAGLPYSGAKLHVADVHDLADGQPVMTDEYCFACTAGSGFT